MTPGPADSVLAVLEAEVAPPSVVTMHTATFASVAAALEQRALRGAAGGMVLHRPPVSDAAVTVIADDDGGRRELAAWPRTAPDEWFLIVTGVEYPLVLVGGGPQGDDLEAACSTEPRIAAAAADAVLRVLARFMPEPPPVPRVAPSPSGLCDSLVALLLQRADAAERRAAVADRAVLDVLEAERRRTAALLHDGPVQDLTAALLFFDGATQDRMAPDPDLVERGMDAVRAAVTSSRNLMDVMVPALHDVDEIATRVHRLVAPLPTAAQARVSVADARALGIADAQLALDVYRIVDALVDNVRRHAGGKIEAVSVAREHGGIVVTVADRGPGGVPALAPGAVSGLAIVQRRVHERGGSLQIASGAAGTTVTARLPVSPAR